MSSLPAAPTVEHVARSARVSTKTVSRVMNGESSVSPATAARVREAAVAVGYAVNRNARQLALGRSGVIGILVYSATQWQWTAELIAGALAGACEAGYNLAPLTLDDMSEESRRAVVERVRAQRLDGLILTTPWSENATLIDDLVRLGLPHVLVPAPEAARAPGVRSDDDLAARLVTDHLLGLGHRRIAALGGQPHLDLTHRRLRGYAAALNAAGIDVDAMPRKLVDYSFRGGLKAAGELLDEPDPPTAILAFTDVLAAAALRAAANRAIAVPDALSVAGIGDQSLAQIITPALTTVAVPTEAMAARAARMLIALAENKPGEREVLFAPSLKIRASTGAAPDIERRDR